MARLKMKKDKILKTLPIVILTLTLPVVVGLINNKTHFLNRAYIEITGQKADLVINISETNTEVRRVWADFAQGGEEKGGMFKAVIPQIKNLNPRYIRIDHVFDFYDVVQKGNGGVLVFNWQKLDSEIYDILATGAKPFISLSYMPSAISTGSEIDVPVSWGDWEDAVKNTIEHISGANNLAITDVYYEVWNEPDLFGNFKLGYGKDYLDLYKYAALGAKRASGTLPYKFGGPGTTGLYKSWFDGLMSFVESENLRMDFFSWHRYSRDIGAYEDDLNNVYSWIMKYPKHKDIELIISESGIDSENNSDYDDVVSAIHALSLYSFFAGLDNHRIFTFEIKDGPGPSQYWGRWGLLTHEKFGKSVAKPRYKAIEFINQVYGKFLPVYGQGTWVRAIAAKNGKDVMVFIVNLDPYGGHYENVPIELINLPSQDVTLKVKEFLGATKEYDIYLGGTKWETSYLMKPNSAVILELVSKE